MATDYFNLSTELDTPQPTPPSCDPALLASRAHPTSAESLRVLLPVGAHVSVIVMSHRQTRAGSHSTILAVLASQDGTPRNVSGMVAGVTGNGRVGGTHGEPSRVSVRGYGRADHAAHRVVADLAVRLYGASTALTPVVI
jgi:hypothetical protein